jgi:hypothetical protein
MSTSRTAASPVQDTTGLESRAMPSLRPATTKRHSVTLKSTTESPTSSSLLASQVRAPQTPYSNPPGPMPSSEDSEQVTLNQEVLHEPFRQYRPRAPRHAAAPFFLWQKELVRARPITFGRNRLPKWNLPADQHLSPAVHQSRGKTREFLTRRSLSWKVSDLFSLFEIVLYRFSSTRITEYSLIMGTGLFRVILPQQQDSFFIYPHHTHAYDSINH